MSKSIKRILYITAAWIITLLIMFCALFSPSGMNVVISNLPYLNFVADIISNFVVIIVILELIVSAAIVIAMVLPDYPKVQAETVLKSQANDVIKALNLLKIRRISLLINIILWVVLIASGWIWTTIFLVISYVIPRINFYYISQYIKNNHIKEVEQMS